MPERNPSSGPIIYNLFPLLGGEIKKWSEHLPRIAAMGFDVVWVNPFHLAGSSGSIYAIADTRRIDPRFQEHDDDGDREIAAFVTDAERHGLRVMLDLVLNHAARDSVLLRQRPEFFARDEKGELVTPFAVDPLVPGNKTLWADLAAFDYADPLGREGLIAHWDSYIARFQRIGVKAFRCDAAHKIDDGVSVELIGAAKRRDASCIFVAETLGCTLDRAAEVAELGFDYIMNNFNYTEFKRLRVLDEYDRLRRIAPSVAFPESHDTPRLAEKFAMQGREIIARELASRYMLSSLFSTGVMMPIGYEWGYRRKLDVAKTTPQWREDTGIDISAEIAAINRLRRSLRPINVEGEQRRLSAANAHCLVLLRGDADRLERSVEATLVIANVSGAPLVIDCDDIFSRAAPFGYFVDRTPGPPANPIFAGTKPCLEPSEVRVLSGRHDRRPRG